MSKKRPLQDQENRSSKRFQPELFDSEDEDEMCRIADEVELWSGDEDWEQCMAQAVDNFEQTFPEQTLKVEQFCQGQPSGNPRRSDGNQQPLDSNQRRSDGNQQPPDGTELQPGDHVLRPNGNHVQPHNPRAGNADLPHVDYAQQHHGNHAQPPNPRAGNADLPPADCVPQHHGNHAKTPNPRGGNDDLPPADCSQQHHANHTQPPNPRAGNDDLPPADGAQQHHANHAQPTNPRAGNDQQSDCNQKANDSHPAPTHDSALNNTVETLRFTPRNNIDIPAAFQDVLPQLRRTIQRLLLQHRNIRGYLSSNVTFSRVQNGEVIQHQQLFRSRILVFANDIDIENNLAEMMREIFERSQEFQTQGSGWSLVSVDNIELHIAQYKPLGGSSFIPLPKEVARSKAVLNIQNQDHKCIVWAILAFLHPVQPFDNPYRVTKYQQYENELKCNGVSFPTPLKDIKKIEQQNNLSIHVFGYDVKDKVYPLFLSKNVIEDRHVNLLLITEGEKRHYCLIRTFSRLMHYRRNHHGSQFFCYNCLHSCISRETLANMQSCATNRTHKQRSCQ